MTDYRSIIESRLCSSSARLWVFLTAIIVIHPVSSAAAQTFADFLVGRPQPCNGAAFAPGETGRIFVTEQFTGDIRLVDLE